LFTDILDDNYTSFDSSTKEQLDKGNNFKRIRAMLLGVLLSIFALLLRSRLLRCVRLCGREGVYHITNIRPANKVIASWSKMRSETCR